MDLVDKIMRVDQPSRNQNYEAFEEKTSLLQVQTLFHFEALLYYEFSYKRSCTNSLLFTALLFDAVHAMILDTTVALRHNVVTSRPVPQFLIMLLKL
jgi:hypothetical protein